MAVRRCRRLRQTHSLLPTASGSHVHRNGTWLCTPIFPTELEVAEFGVLLLLLLLLLSRFVVVVVVSGGGGGFVVVVYVAPSP